MASPGRPVAPKYSHHDRPQPPWKTHGMVRSGGAVIEPKTRTDFEQQRGCAGGERLLIGWLPDEAPPRNFCRCDRDLRRARRRVETHPRPVAIVHQ